MSAFTEELKQIRKNAVLIHDEATMMNSYHQLAENISENMADSNPLLVPVMMGGVYLCGQLMQRLDFPLELGYLHATRYRNKLQGDELKWLVPPSAMVADRTVLIVDDILDQGITLAGIIDKLKQAGAAEVQSAVLTTKICPRAVDVGVTYSGVDVPDKYVFGCGMDYRGYWRNLPEIYAVAGS
ncbi:MAG: hypoxanthine-guanine phosphoribosyltransferase [Pseudomonadota bacterium]|nr:hypoxanthine-guanine phosphoribosyltransferase [Pseudomonadota bacterium]